MSLAVFFRSETKKKCIPACCAAGREGDSRINSIKKLMTLSIADMKFYLTDKETSATKYPEIVIVCYLPPPSDNYARAKFQWYLVYEILQKTQASRVECHAPAKCDRHSNQ